MLVLWSGLEALFETGQGEVKLRHSLYLAQLQARATGRLDYQRRVKKSYDARSAATHRAKPIDHTVWLDAWGLACDACTAVLRRGSLPSGDDLLEELLADSS